MSHGWYKLQQIGSQPNYHISMIMNEHHISFLRSYFNCTTSIETLYIYCSAQAEGLLCEEGGTTQNVRYCGYCTAHAKKMVSVQ